MEKEEAGGKLLQGRGGRGFPSLEGNERDAEQEVTSAVRGPRASELCQAELFAGHSVMGGVPEVATSFCLHMKDGRGLGQ